MFSCLKHSGYQTEDDIRYWALIVALTSSRDPILSCPMVGASTGPRGEFPVARAFPKLVGSTVLGVLCSMETLPYGWGCRRHEIGYDFSMAWETQTWQSKSWISIHF